MEREDIGTRIEELEEEERALSASRRRLHDRLALCPEMGGDDLARRERELSDRRRELHAEIDELRSKRDADGNG
jgi:hypothetical protein